MSKKSCLGVWRHTEWCVLLGYDGMQLSYTDTFNYLGIVCCWVVTARN